ncbi:MULTISPECIES: hypothetical protein [Enterobacterales]|uniref:hypothetical protein n=1 Tax=Enterobacterales TaxID=91347 RepID=UPI002EDA76CB
MSHFVKKYTDPEHGGMGTYDYDDKGKKPETKNDNWSTEQHNRGADTLVNKGREDVFNNAYNIERYFIIDA